MDSKQRRKHNLGTDSRWFQALTKDDETIVGTILIENEMRKWSPNDWNHAPWNLCPDISDLHSSAQVSAAKLDLGEEWCKSNFPSSNWEASSPWVQINRSHGLHVLTPKIYGDTMCLCLCINNIIRINFIPSISDNSPTFTDRVSKFTHCARPLR